MITPILTNTLSGFKINLASPEEILSWSLRKLNNNTYTGEVKEPLTINLKNGKPKLNGLFCEKIFGPVFSWKCICGLYTKKNSTLYTSFCEVCGVELNTNKIRRARMGHILLNVPIAHKLYFKNILPILLNITLEELETLIYYKEINFNTTKLYKNSFYYRKNKKYINISKLLYISDFFKQNLENLNILNEINFCREYFYEVINNPNLKKQLIKKINLLHLLLIGNIKPSWLFLEVLPVLPAGIRPFVKLKNNNYITNYLNEIYRTIVLRNNQIKRLKRLRNNISFIFELIEKRLLQQSVDMLLDTDLKSFKEKFYIKTLISSLKGKSGIFRQYLLGKRVDFSGRSVITSGPDLLLNNIGVSTHLSLKIFKPILLNLLKKNKTIHTLLQATFLTSYNSVILKRILNYIFKTEVILINRAPTLHRMNLQAFKPYLIEGDSLKLWPIVCSSFNADFDGDQMGIFLILSSAAKKEAKLKIAVDKNIFSPVLKRNMFELSQNSILGLFFMVILKYGIIKNYIFSNKEDALITYYHNLIELETPIWVRELEILHTKKIKIKKYNLNTVGRLLLNYYL